MNEVVLLREQELLNIFQVKVGQFASNIDFSYQLY